ncbi:hypothetical protein GCM10017557_31370 [Streptomyces aurantiacus]|uniref:Uncharacterized protein n=1 Tax=Streptomyces aurantiacus TaxID=47760 RepID=A0A7G1NYL9_9ACTN|nr:hypothetical protein GCM10017557_31370 [Streptomyces aurantiacus]
MSGALTYALPLTRTARDCPAAGFVGPDVRVSQGRARRKPRVAPLEREAYAGAPWDLVPEK